MKEELRRKSAKRAAKKVAKQMVKARKKMLKEVRKKQIALMKSQKKAMKNRLKNSSKKVKREKSDLMTSEASTDNENTMVTKLDETEVSEIWSDDLRITGDESSAESKSDDNSTKEFNKLDDVKSSENGKVNSHETIQESDNLSTNNGTTKKSKKKDKKNSKFEKDKKSVITSEAEDHSGYHDVDVNWYTVGEIRPRSSVTDQFLDEQDNPKNEKSKENKKDKPKNSKLEDSTPSIKRGWKNPFGKTNSKTTITTAGRPFIASRKSVSSSTPFARSESTEDKPAILARSASVADESDPEGVSLDSEKPANSRLGASISRKSLLHKRSAVLHLPKSFFNADEDGKTGDLLQKAKKLPGIDRLEQRIQRSVLERQAMEALNDPSFNMMLFNLAKQVMLDDQLVSKVGEKEKQKMARCKNERKRRQSEWLAALKLILKSQNGQSYNKSNLVEPTHQPRQQNRYTNPDERIGDQVMPDNFEEERKPSSDFTDSSDSHSTSNSAEDHDHRLHDIRRLCNVIQLVHRTNVPSKKRHRFRKQYKSIHPELRGPQGNTCQLDSHEYTPFMVYPFNEPQLTTCISAGLPNYVYLSPDPSVNFVSPITTYNGILFPDVTNPQTVCFPELYYW